MKEKTFYIVLGALFIISSALLFWLTSLDLFAEFKALFFGALVFFVLLTILLYYVSKVAAVHKNKMLFLYVMMFAILIKFGFVLITLFIYNRIFTPETKLYVLPFIGIYVIFTIFETYFMMKLGKLKPEEIGD